MGDFDDGNSTHVVSMKFMFFKLAFPADQLQAEIDAINSMGVDGERIVLKVKCVGDQAMINKMQVSRFACLGKRKQELEGALYDVVEDFTDIDLCATGYSLTIQNGQIMP